MKTSNFNIFSIKESLHLENLILREFESLFNLKTNLN